MKVAYVTCEDPQDMHAWSGLVHHIGSALQQHAEVGFVGPLPYRRFCYDKARQILCEATSRKIHKRGREARLLKHYAGHAEPGIRRLQPDIVFACSTLPIAYVSCAQPVVVWIDSTFAGLVDYYPEFSNLCPHVIAIGNAAEQRALDRCRRVIFSSDWAAQTALQHYRLAPEKIAVVPFGANLDGTPAAEEVRAAIGRRSTSVCRLVFVGVEWHRKGADLAIRVTEGLRHGGIPAELTIAGCQPPNGIALPGGVRLAGFISKRTAEGRAQLARLYSEAHFLVFPSRAECYGVVVAEANSFGVPVVASDTGGISTALRAERNGVSFPLDDFVRAAAAYIADHWSNWHRYEALAQASHKEFDTRLNWPVAGAMVAELCERVVGEVAGAPIRL
jgi:glycosyltransferase involved in cell wall biosynthesis